MSEHEPPATIGVPRATTKSRHTGFGRFRCEMHAQRSPLTHVLIRSDSCAEAGSILRHRPLILTYRIVEEI
jgi:hypothetical protein